MIAARLLLLLAHPGAHPPALGELLRSWTWDPLVIGVLVISASLYWRGVGRLWRAAGRGHGIRRWEAACYAAGITSLALALISPLDALSDRLFSAHMGQHEILMLIGAPLLVLGRPFIGYLWALPPRTRESVGHWARRPQVAKSWRFLTGPFVTLVTHGIVVWLWHIPALFEAALASEAVHAVQHLSFFLTSALFFWALVHGRYGKAGYGVAVLYVFATAMHTSILGALLSVGGRVVYATHEQRTIAWGIDPLDDQRLAGLIMWIPAGVIFTVIGLALFAAWLGEAERRAARRPLPAGPIEEANRP